MKKNCAISGHEFLITDADRKFHEKMGVPAPNICPEERLRRKLAWRNERKLYHRTCDATGKKILSVFSPDKPYKVYEKSYFASDKWDAKSFGREVDFQKPIFKQIYDLSLEVPKQDLVKGESIENSDFINHGGFLKNCYLVFDICSCQDCYYGNTSVNSTDVCDFLAVKDGQLCYEVVNCSNMYNVHYSENCKNCSDSSFLIDCVGCKYCFGGVNLRQKSYVFWGKQLTKDEYFKRLKEWDFGKYSHVKKLLEHLKNLKTNSFRRAMYLTNCENSTGDFLENCKNVKSSYECIDCEDCKYCTVLLSTKDAYDHYSWEIGSERIYDSLAVGDYSYNIFYSSNTSPNCANLYYSQYCDNTKNALGCVGLKHDKFCILNKQYSEAEYKALFSKVVEHMKHTGEWGQFPPPEYSPFAYNETIALDYFPLSREEVLKRDWKWKDDDTSTKYSGQKYDVPDSIDDVSNDVLTKILECETCLKNYRIVKPELDYYKKVRVPIPRQCFNCRHDARIVRRNPRTLFERTCDKCGVDIQTTFAPARPEKIYCEKCYLNAVI